MEINALNIKQHRKKLNLTQQELADLIGVSKNTIVNYEKGMKIPESKIPILKKILYNENINIVLEEPELYKQLTPIEIKIFELLDTIQEKEKELENIDKKSLEYKLRIQIIQELLYRLEILKSKK